jgi:hypothetical protein
MKKLLIITSLLMFVGCRYHVRVEHSFVTDYVYVNKSSSDISIHAFAANEGLDSLFVIPVEGNHILRNFDDTGTKPLIWRGYPTSDKDYVVISNGEKTVTKTRTNSYDVDNLYNGRNYIQLPDFEILHPYPTMITTSIYVFTDEFFENGEN